MPAFCFHFLTLMDIVCSTIVSTATHLDWLNTNPNKTTEEICFQKCLKPTGHTTFVMFNWAHLWSSTTCWRGSEKGQHKSPPQQRDLTLQAMEERHHQLLLECSCFQIVFHCCAQSIRMSKAPESKRRQLHKNGENIMSPRPCTWCSRHQVENRSGVNKPGDFQTAHPRCVKQVLREQTILLLLWKESELLGKCLYLCKPQKWRLITENQFHYSKRIFFPHSLLPSSLKYVDNGIISFLDTEHFVL